MPRYAQVLNTKVVNVIEALPDVIEALKADDPDSLWIVNEDANIGDTYDKDRDVFVAPYVAPVFQSSNVSGIA